MFQPLKFFNKGFFMLVLCSSAACHLLHKPSDEELFSNEDSYLKHFSRSDQKKSPLDQRQMKSITLKNKLEILLISSKNYDKSSAAMDVATGSLEDPTDSPGMAHFLEHMLFLGTRKYPEVGEYSEYLSANQGMSNAYTDKENTNYYFEVNSEAFDGALDRFAQFFIEPLFLEDYVEREMNAVNSEHQKNLKSDPWRKNRALSLMLHKNHPGRKFSTGTLETLKKIKQKDLINFYHKQYSANQMKLVLMSPLPLDKLEALVKKNFSSIKNTNRRKHEYQEKLYDTKNLPQEVSIKSIKDLRELELIFATPSNEAYWRSKPSHLINFLVGHEGEGSLLSFLKRKGLATSLSSWFEERSYAGQFHFKMALTEKGLKQKDELIKDFFSYIRLLKSTRLPLHVYEEVKKMSDIEFVYKEHMEGGSIASYYASKLQRHPALELEKQTELFLTYNNDHYQKFLSYIDPTRMTVSLSTNEIETDQSEEYYNVEFSNKKINKIRASHWHDAGLQEEMFLPEKNTYMPASLALLKEDISNPARQILSTEEGVFWFQEDKEFKQPKGKVSILLETPLPSSSPDNKVKTILYQRALEESLNEWRYQINLAGLDFSISYHARGLQIVFEGYSEHLPKLMKQVANRLDKISITEEHFNTIKKDFKRGLENLNYEAAYQKVLYALNDLSKPDSIHYESYYNKETNLDLISNKTLSEIKDFSKELFKTFSLEGLAYGNLTETSVKNSALYYFERFNAKKLPEAKRKKDSTYEIKDGESLALILQSKTESPNHSWGRYVQFGSRSMKLNAILRVSNAILQPDFYHELRTEKQLGYIVHAGLRYSEKALGLIFIVQSPNHNPFEIKKHFDIWEKSILSKLENISDFELEGLKNAASIALREKDKTIAEKHGTLYFEAITMENTFEYKSKLADIVEKLTKKDLVDFFKEFFEKEKKKALTIYLDKDRKKETYDKVAETETIITDKANYKQSRSSF